MGDPFINNLVDFDFLEQLHYEYVFLVFNSLIGFPFYNVK